jgi:hypothetical protein
MKQESIEADTPTIKRVVNIKCLRFKSINENFETRSRPPHVVDFNKLNFSLKEVSFSDKDENYSGENNDDNDNDKKSLHSHAKISPQSPTTTATSSSQHQQRLRKDPLLKQTLSELDIGENFEISKTNPIFESESKSKLKYEKAISEPNEPTTTLASIKSNANNTKSTLSSMSRLMLPRMSKEHIYEDLYQSVDPRTKTNNTYDTFYHKLDTHGTTKSNSDFRLTINIENQTSNSGPPPPPPSSLPTSSSSNPNENDPIYIDPADFAKDQEPPLHTSSFDKDITIVNLSNGTIGKSLGKTILTDSNINDMYKSALTEKLKLNNNNNNNTKKSLASGSNQVKGNSESSGVSTMFGSFLKNDDSSTSDEFSFQSQLYKESIRSESGFVGFNYRKATTDFLAEVK